MITGRILLNIMYTGKYISDYNKIGHEIINLFKADNGNNYIYITPHGTVTGKVDIVLMARSINGGSVELLGKADGLEAITNDTKIKYCGYTISEIMSRANQEKAERFITFKCNDVRKPARRIILTSDQEQKNERLFIPGVKRLANQSMKYYFDEGDMGYRKLQDIINNVEFWEKNNTTKMMAVESLTVVENRSFLSIIGKTDDELVFSNLLAYYFSEYPKIFQNFTKEVLGLDASEDIEDYEVQREAEHIDILIETKQYVIVIENKVRSGINSVKGNKSQLSKYYKFAEKIANGRIVKCYVLCSNYNTINLQGLEYSDKYEIIKYKKIYEFFVNHGEYAVYDRYYGDFLSALKPHTKDVYNDWEEVLKNRFSREIRKLSTKGKH